MSLARTGVFSALGLVALLSLGCSDPVPPTPRGAWVIYFESPSSTECPILGFTAKMGDVTDRTKTKEYVDGEGTASVDCTVSGSGSFSVTAQAAQTETAVGMTMSIGNIAATATSAMPAIGSVSFSSEESGGEYISPVTGEPCNFYFIEGSGEGVAAGKIWVAFECPKMQLDQATGCRIRESYAIFENCGT